MRADVLQLALPRFGCLERSETEIIRLHCFLVPGDQVVAWLQAHSKVLVEAPLLLVGTLGELGWLLRKLFDWWRLLLRIGNTNILA